MKRLICWGGKENQDSFRWIMGAYHQAALKTGIHTLWVANKPENACLIDPGDTVLCPDVFQEHLPYVEGASYVLHNFDNDHSEVCQALAAHPERHLRLQVWTSDAQGESWGPCRSFDLGARTLFMPWGTSLLAEEFMEPVFNGSSREVIFVGAVWSDQYQGKELGNEEAIEHLRTVCKANGLTFTHRTQISENEMIDLTRSSRLAPTVVGNWQVEKGYMPCRSFKVASYGVAMVSNSGPVNELFGTTNYPSVGEMLEGALRLKQRDYLELVRAQQRVAASFTYRESLAAIDRAFAEMQ